LIPVQTNASSDGMRRDDLMKLRTWDAHSHKIESEKQKRKFHRGKVIVAIRRNRSCPSYRTYFSEGAAGGSPLAARFLNPLKIVVEHSSMTNQAHLFRQLDVSRSDQGTTPRTDDVVHVWLFLVLKMETLIQFGPSLTDL